MRGIHFVQIPTTLLAQVDSSVGGKVGVNLDEAKNMVGAFYQPIIVLIDPDLLRTLPRREIRAGLAEVIKYGMIRDQELFVFLEESIGKILSFDIQSITNVIMRSCRIKAEVVSKDEKERGYRAILNYGHTVAHAIETLTQYRTFLHGEAVAIGMVTEAKVAVLLGIFGETEERRQTELIKRAGLPTRLEGVDPNRIIDVIKLDKKVRDEEPRFVLPRRIGDVIIRGNIENGLIFEALRELMG
jgi:3-dehydroquinate synthase